MCGTSNRRLSWVGVRGGGSQRPSQGPIWPSSVDPETQGVEVTDQDWHPPVANKEKWRSREAEKLDRGTQQVLWWMFLVGGFLMIHSWAFPKSLIPFLRDDSLAQLSATGSKLWEFCSGIRAPFWLSSHQEIALCWVAIFVLQTGWAL